MRVTGTLQGMEIQGVVRLNEGKDKKIRHFYPWVYAEDIHRAEGVVDGQLARLVDINNEFLAIGTFNRSSRFQFKVLTCVDEKIDESFFRKRFEVAKANRSRLLIDSNARREVFSEADQLSGLIVDRYRDILVLQVRSLGMETLKPLWLPALIDVYHPSGVLERSDMAGRAEEGLESFTGELYGSVPPVVVIHENGLQFNIPLKEGLKTGAYLDQRETKKRLHDRILPGDRVLDTFCYTGGFALSAAKAGAEATGVDIHAVALEFATSNAKLNGLVATFVEDNAFEYLENIAPLAEAYDWIILDPPAIAKNKTKRESLKWAIWKLVFHALPCLKPGGSLIVCNCSYQLSLSDTLDAARLAGGDRGTRLFFDEVTYQGPDHQSLASFPESLYLKCLWLRKAAQ